MARDLKDAWDWLDRLMRKADRLAAGGMLENSSITNGRMRFIGGLLRLDSGATLEVVGTASIEGPTAIKGALTVTGTASIEGPLAIKGALTVTGTASIEGPLTIKGTTVVEGDLAVKKTLDVTATTRLRAKTTLEADLELTSGGSIKAGAIRIDPLGDNSGRITGGSVLDIIAGGLIRLLSDVSFSGRIFASALPTRTRASSNGAATGTVWTDGTQFFRVID